VPAPGDVAVDDVDPGAVVELRVLQALRRVELAVGGSSVVQKLRQRAQDVLVVVEDLVVVPGRAPVPAHEDRVGGVEHDLPDVVVAQERRERAVAGQVAERPLDDERRIGQPEGPAAAAVVVVPAGHLVGDERAQLGLTAGRRHLQRDVLGPLLHGALDLHQRRHPGGRSGGGHASTASS
jgi:hypothetical protein